MDTLPLAGVTTEEIDILVLQHGEGREAGTTASFPKLLLHRCLSLF